MEHCRSYHQNSYHLLLPAVIKDNYVKIGWLWKSDVPHVFERYLCITFFMESKPTR